MGFSEGTESLVADSYNHYAATCRRTYCCRAKFSPITIYLCAVLTPKEGLKCKRDFILKIQRFLFKISGFWYIPKELG